MKKLITTFALLALAGVAQAQTLKIATLAPENSQWMKDMKASAAEIKERTDGRVNIRYYGGGAMGDDNAVLARMKLGTLAGGAFTPLSLASQYPDLNLYGLPMVFASEEEAAFVRETLDARLEEGLKGAGYENFGFAAGGFAILMSNEPIDSLDDMKGKRVWVPEGDSISYASMQALDLSPVTLPVTDVLTGLQTGLLDVVAMSPIGALVFQWHTRVKYVTEMPLVYTLGFMAVTEKQFNRIKPDDQAVVREVMRRTYENFDAQNLKDNAAARETLLSSRTGIQTVEFEPAEFDRIRDVMLDSNRQLGLDGEFSVELYDEMLELVESFRNGAGKVAAE